MTKGMDDALDSPQKFRKINGAPRSSHPTKSPLRDISYRAGRETDPSKYKKSVFLTKEKHGVYFHLFNVRLCPKSGLAVNRGSFHSLLQRRNRRKHFPTPRRIFRL